MVEWYNCITVLVSPPHSLWATTRSRFIFVKQLVLNWRRCDTNDNLRSNMTPRNLNSFSTGMSKLFSLSNGSQWGLIQLQKWTQTVLVVENLKPFWLAHVERLFSVNCSCLSIDLICRDLWQIQKSSKNRELSVEAPIHLTILLIFKPNKVTARTLPCGTPFCKTKRSETVELTRHLKVRVLKKFWINKGRRPRKPASAKSLSIPYHQVVSYAFSRLKKTTTTCSPLMKPSRIHDSKRTKWSTLHLCCLNPHWILVKMPLPSKKYISLLLIILSRSLHKQLVRDMGL